MHEFTSFLVLGLIPGDMKRLVQFQTNQILQDKQKEIEGSLSYDKAQMQMRGWEKRSAMFYIG